MRKKLAGWKEKLLSKAGKEVLIKAVAQDIFTYMMSCFKIPDSLCDDMTTMIQNFWWGKKDDNKPRCCLKSWESICTKKYGRFGRALKRWKI